MLALEQRGLVFCAVARMQAEITRRPASCWCFTCMTMWREGSWMQRSVWQSDNRNVTSLRCVSNVAAQFSLYCFWLQVVLSASATRPCYTTVQEVGNERVTGATHLTWLHLSVWSGESEEEDLCPSHVCWDSADTHLDAGVKTTGVWKCWAGFDTNLLLYLFLFHSLFSVTEWNKSG